MDLGGRVMSFLGKKDNVVHLLLAGAFVALGVRSSSQQDDIDALEAEKESLRRSNKAMQTAMWDWRQRLFHLAESDPVNFPISLSRLRAVYGEEEDEAAAASAAGASSTTLPTLRQHQDTGEMVLDGKRNSSISQNLETIGKSSFFPGEIGVPLFAPTEG